MAKCLICLPAFGAVIRPGDSPSVSLPRQLCGPLDLCQLLLWALYELESSLCPARLTFSSFCTTRSLYINIGMASLLLSAVTSAVSPPPSAVGEAISGIFGSISLTAWICLLVSHSGVG